MLARDATPDDAKAITRIYNQGIEDRLATLETELRTPDERIAWMAAKSERHPVLVAIDESGEIAGWGSLNQITPGPPPPMSLISRSTSPASSAAAASAAPC